MKNTYFASARMLYNEKAPDASRSEKSEKAPEAVKAFSAKSLKEDAKVLSLIAKEKGKPAKAQELLDNYEKIGSNLQFAKDYCAKNGIKFMIENGSLAVNAKDGKTIDNAWQKHLQEIAGSINVIRKSLGVSAEELQARVAALRKDGQMMG